MKIKNDLIRIDIGNKKYEFSNLILNEYLNKFAQSQLKYTTPEERREKNKFLRSCFIKFDEPIENINENSALYESDFDIQNYHLNNFSQSISERNVCIQYLYDFQNVVRNVKTGETEELHMYDGRKITALGFTSEANRGLPICAVLDTSNYNMYVQENQDLLVTRRDIIESDAYFYSSNSKFAGPIHLAPYEESIFKGSREYYDKEDDSYISRNTYYLKSFLHSVGFSSHLDYIAKEFILGKDVNIETNDSEITIRGLNNYLSNENSIFGSNNLYPRNTLYPVKANYKYIIFKYKIYEETARYDFYDEIPFIDTGDYYYQAIPIDKFGKLDLKIKYERG